jgi:serine O-acetyltransferase
MPDHPENAGSGSLLKKSWFAFRSLLTIPHRLLYRRSSVRPVIDKDIERWMEILQPHSFSQDNITTHLNYLLLKHPEYRNLFYYRLGRESILVHLLGIILKPVDTLFISTDDIGEGLFIQHGFCTIIVAEKIGKNCWINQQVTIGHYVDRGSPVIGDNVRIAAGAKVIGGITIGNNVIVGANAVVVKNVPANCTVVGVPAYIVRRDGVKTNEPLS